MIEHIEQHERCAVLAAMGSGKTSATLTALDHVELIEPSGPTLVIAPKLVASSTWPNELEKWDHLADKRIVPIGGTAAQRMRALRDSNADIYTVGYHNLPWLVNTVGADWPWRKVVADELTRLKSFRLQQKGGAQACQLGRVAHRYVDRFIGLTGTPAPNGLADLWGQMWFIDKGQRLGLTYTGFKERWFRQGFNGFGLEPLPFAQEQIQDSVADVCLTVDPKDYISIDDPIVTPLYVDLPPSARRIYTEMERAAFTEIRSGGVDVEVEAVNAGSKVNKCSQIASGFLFTDSDGRFEELHDIKLDMLEQVLEEANGMPVVVAYHYVPDLIRLKKRFPYGKTPEDLGANIEKEWNSGKHRLLFAHPMSLGHGLNLQDAGNILCFYGFDWNLETHLQIIERIGPLRQYQAGHPRAVYLYYIMAKGTIDEVKYQRLIQKKSVQDCFLEYMRRTF
jgi:SNF2 family DNA or RNA helicase